MKKICPECGENMITSHRSIAFYGEDIKNYHYIPMLTYVCTSCGFSVTPENGLDRVKEIIEDIE